MIFTGALLFRIHLCQNDSEELYKGTSKGTEGYAARMLYKEARDLGITVEINWQDDDSSTSKAIREIYPEAEIMICRGHEGRSHLNQLKKLKSLKKFTTQLFAKHKKHIPDLKNESCCCTRHKKGCGCFTDKFILNSRNSFSRIASSSDSKEEFEERVRGLYHHAIDEHVWDGGACDFHSLVVCSCGKCPDKTNFMCEGKDYHTREKLSCPFHMMAYRTEIEHRARKAASLIHSELKAGHTNSMEASHNVLIRFRQKFLAFQKNHYELATDLGLLQANLTAMRLTKGSHYHWIPVLYERLGMPLYTGIEDALEAYGKTRDKYLAKVKEKKHKERRIQLKIKKKVDGQKRIEWSKKRGNDTYGPPRKRKENKKETETDKTNQSNKSCTRGSSTHSRTSHRDGPSTSRSV